MKKILIATMITAMAASPMAFGIDDATIAAAQASVAQQQQQQTQSQAASEGNKTFTLVPITFNGPSDAATKAAADAQVAAAHEAANGTATLNYNLNQSGTSTVKTVPPVYAPNIVTSNDTCMGSSSIGASGVGFGVSFGTSWTDANCIMLKNAREMYNMGMPDVAFARLCMDALNREAIELTGKVCPQTAREEKAKAEAAQQAAAQ